MSLLCRNRSGSLCLVWLLAVCPIAARADALRVCADPNNLPFSNRSGEGFENALATLVARAIGRDPVEYVWWPQRRGFVRNTLDAGRCDVIMGVPAGYELAEPTSPYYRSSYAFVYREDAGYEIDSFDDPRLTRLRIGVPVVGDDYANTPGAAALAERGIIDNVVGFSVYGDYSQPNPPARIIEAVADGAIDLAIVWGPLAGYFADRQRVPLKVVPVPAGAAPETSFVFDIAMATRPEDGELNAALDRALADHRDEVRALLQDYGVPLLDAPPPSETAETIHET